MKKKLNNKLNQMIGYGQAFSQVDQLRYMFTAMQSTTFLQEPRCLDFSKHSFIFHTQQFYVLDFL